MYRLYYYSDKSVCLTAHGNICVNLLSNITSSVEMETPRLKPWVLIQFSLALFFPYWNEMVRSLDFFQVPQTLDDWNCVTQGKNHKLHTNRIYLPWWWSFKFKMSTGNIDKMLASLQYCALQIRVRTRRGLLSERTAGRNWVLSVVPETGVNAQTKLFLPRLSQCCSNCFLILFSERQALSTFLDRK